MLNFEEVAELQEIDKKFRISRLFDKFVNKDNVCCHQSCKKKINTRTMSSNRRCATNCLKTTREQKILLSQGKFLALSKTAAR